MPNLTEKQIQWITWGVIAVVFVIATVLGISLPITLPPPPAISQGITGFDKVAVDSGTAALPSFTFTGDPDNGLYRIGANDIGIAAGGSKVGEFSSAGYTGYVVVPGGAEGYPAYDLQVDVTRAEINAGHTIVTVPAAKAFRLVHATATAYGGTCDTSTSVYLKAGATTKVTWTVANLVQSTLLDMTTTGTTLVADGASFTAGTAGDDVTVISDAATTGTCTGVRVVLSYVLQ